MKIRAGWRRAQTGWCRVGLSALAAAAISTGVRSAAAEGPTAGPAYQLSAGVDVPAVLLPAVISSSFFLSSELAGPYCAPRCDPKTLNAIDRGSAGNYSVAWSNVGNVAVIGTLAAAPLFLFLGEKPSHALNDFIVVGESTLFASATQVLTSFAVSRPRPRVYGTKAPLEERTSGDAARSFFSGHTATCFAATVSTFLTLRKIDRPELAWVELGVGGAGSILLSISRVGAGSHFPTDVAAGAAVGIGIGMLVPSVHRTFADDAGRVRASVRLLPLAEPGATGGALAGVF